MFQKRKYYVSKEDLDKIQRGLLAVNIQKSVICDHNFVAYIDSNYHVRNYCTTDFEILVPENQSEIAKADINIEKLDPPFLLKINLNPSILSYILKGIFLKERILIVSDKDFLNSHILNFFNYITTNSFKMDILIISEKEYLDSNQEFEDTLIFHGNKIIANDSLNNELEEVFIVEKFIEKFLSEKDLQRGLILLKNEIQKAYSISKIFRNIIQKSKEKKQKINPEKIISELEEEHTIKISSKYLEFIYKILENYFEIKVPKKIRKIFQFFLGISYF